MNEESFDEEQEEIDDFMHNKLKDIDTSTIEKTIAGAIGELIGVDYKCRLEEIKYGDYRFKGGQLIINLSEKFKGFGK